MKSWQTKDMGKMIAMAVIYNTQNAKMNKLKIPHLTSENEFKLQENMMLNFC